MTTHKSLSMAEQAELQEEVERLRREVEDLRFANRLAYNRDRSIAEKVRDACLTQARATGLMDAAGDAYSSGYNESAMDIIQSIRNINLSKVIND